MGFFTSAREFLKNNDKATIADVGWGIICTLASSIFRITCYAATWALCNVALSGCFIAIVDSGDTLSNVNPLLLNSITFSITLIGGGLFVIFCALAKSENRCARWGLSLILAVCVCLCIYILLPALNTSIANRISKITDTRNASYIICGASALLGLLLSLVNVKDTVFGNPGNELKSTLNIK